MEHLIRGAVAPDFAIFDLEGNTQRLSDYRGLPFPVIPNPDGQLYRLYQVEHSMGGLLLGMLRLPSLIRAVFDPLYRMANPDSSVTHIPADVLIADSYYGRDIGDHIPSSASINSCWNRCRR